MMLKNNQHFAFNIWDFESAKAVIDAAALLHQDVILQTSTGIYKQLPAKPFVSFVKCYSEYKGVHAWLNIDHCKEKEMLFSAVDNGWDMVMADGSSMSITENIAFTNAITYYAHSKGVFVEAEVGQVKGIEDGVIVQQDTIASRGDIERFLKSTDVDFIAVAFGNAHGEYKAEPNLYYDLLEYTTSITVRPFVVHGGSGLSDDILIRLISTPGVKKINISTELKIAYYNGIKQVAEKQLRNGFQPVDAVTIIHDSIMNTVLSKMKLIKEGLQ